MELWQKQHWKSRDDSKPSSASSTLCHPAEGLMHNVSPAVVKIITVQRDAVKDGSGYCCAEEALPFTQPNGPGLPKQLKLPVGTGRQHGLKEKTCSHYDCSIF